MMKNVAAFIVSSSTTLCGSIFVNAANVYIRPGANGNNTGTDWTNAYNGMPSALIRGNTYYLATGSYGSYTFDDANSGTTLITIKKATTTDHGTETGWSSAYGTGQAVFSSWLIYTDYYTFDGQLRNTNWRTGGVDQYGIKTGNTRIDNGNGIGGDHLTFRYIDFHGGGRDTGAGDDVIYGLAGNSYITFQNCSLRDSDRTIFGMRGNWQYLTVDSSYMARNTSTPAMHGELLSTTDSTNVVFSNNAIEDIEGTAVWAILNGGVASNWKIFGNTIHHTPAYIANTGRPTTSSHNYGVSGVIFCANDASNDNTCNNFQFYNNTIVTIVGLWSGVVIQKGSGNIVENNLWYDSTRTATGVDIIGWNWYFNTWQDGDSTSTKQVCTTNCDIFVSLANRDFRLKSPTQAGTTLSAPYNIDPNNITRGADGIWDRGAFEYNSGSSTTSLKAPSNLRISN